MLSCASAICRLGMFQLCASAWLTSFGGIVSVRPFSNNDRGVGESFNASSWPSPADVNTIRCEICPKLARLSTHSTAVHPPSHIPSFNLPLSSHPHHLLSNPHIVHLAHEPSHHSRLQRHQLLQLLDLSPQHFALDLEFRPPFLRGRPYRKSFSPAAATRAARASTPTGKSRGLRPLAFGGSSFSGTG